MCNKFVILYISTGTLAALPHNTKLRIYGWMFLSASSFLCDQCFCATPTFKCLVIPVMVLKCNIYCMKNIKLGFTWHLVTCDGCWPIDTPNFTIDQSNCVIDASVPRPLLNGLIS